MIPQHPSQATSGSPEEVLATLKEKAERALSELEVSVESADQEAIDKLLATPEASAFALLADRLEQEVRQALKEDLNLDQQRMYVGSGGQPTPSVQTLAAASRHPFVGCQIRGNAMEAIQAAEAATRAMLNWPVFHEDAARGGNSITELRQKVAESASQLWSDAGALLAAAAPWNFDELPTLEEPE